MDAAKGTGLTPTIRTNLRIARLNAQEIGGSLGDLGTFLPLLVGMTVQNGLNLTAALFFAGLFNVVTGLLFSIPLAVQPMKAIAAVAITEGLAPGELASAGAIVGALILALALAGAVDKLVALIPRPVVRGLQLALGLRLTMTGFESVLGTEVVLGPDSYITGAIAAVMVIMVARWRRIPAALVLFLAGLALAIWTEPRALGSLTLGASIPDLIIPTSEEWRDGLLRGAVPQLPLTLLNSVVAVTILAWDLFPDRDTSARRIASSVGLMNLTTVWFGAMPMCHGAGGLAGQVRFGAQTNGSILFLGAAKMLLALLFGASLLTLCQEFPASILGVMLIFAGVELASVCRDQTTRRGALGMLLTTGAILATNMALGLVVGLALVVLMRVARSSEADEAAHGDRRRR